MDNIKQLREHISKSLSMPSSEINKLTKIQEERNLYKLLTGEDVPKGIGLEELVKRNAIINGMTGLVCEQKVKEIADKLIEQDISLYMVNQLIYLVSEGYSNKILGGIDG